MKRVQLFEFEDFNWFPSIFRDSMTKLIVVLHKMMGIKDVLAELVSDVLKQSNSSRIVDLGSGSGGPMPLVQQTLLEKGQKIDLIMTDLYSNKSAMIEFNSDTTDAISYHSSSVDATDLKNAPEGVKTLINSFHHMPPTQAKKILRSAQESKQHILIYEMAENNIPLLLWWLFLPISLVVLIVMTLFMTPYVKKLTWQQVVFTYLIPIIPICYAWDGQASLPRMYTMNDIDQMLNEFPSDEYIWKKGVALNAKGKKQGTYLVGKPK
jgi:hypothetical protein